MGIVKERMLFRQSAHFVEVIITLQKKFQKDTKGKGKTRAVDVSSNRQMERTPQKCFRCGSQYHMITKFPKPPKDNKKGESKYVLMKKVIVHATTAKITTTRRYMNLWRKCLAMT